MNEIKDLIKQVTKPDNAFNQVQFEREFRISMEELSKVREKPRLVQLNKNK